MKVPVSLRRQILVLLVVILFMFMTVVPPHGRSSQTVVRESNVVVLDDSGSTRETMIQTQSVVLNITGPIAIDGDTNLISTAANSGWSGDGGKDTPFIIEYLNITGNAAASAIAITGTSLYITIQHSIFDNAAIGIELTNVQNALIYNNTISNSYEGGITVTSATNNNVNVSSNIINKNTLHGVYMTSTGKANVSDNQIEFNGWSGMYLRGNDKIVERNIITKNNNSGIHLVDPVNVQVRGNYVGDNSQSGSYNSITLTSTSTGSNNVVEDNFVITSGVNGISFSFIDDSIIRNNTVFLGQSAALRLSESNNNEIYDNYFRLANLGIYIDFASDSNHIHNNIIYQILTDGILLGDSISNTLIHNNTVSKTNNYGIRIGSTLFGAPRMGNQIYWNNFIKNNDRAFEDSQAYDYYGDANFTSNFWDDIWVGTDGNGDGFIDTPYFVDEQFSNTTNDDSKALAGPVNPEHHFLGPPSITEPVDGEIINRYKEIQWSGVTDHWGHEVTYSLYYSSDGNTWIEIATGITLTWYDWDTAGIANGTDYRLKIVATDEIGVTIEEESRFRFSITNPDHVLIPAEITLLSDGDLIDIAYTIRWTFGDSSWNKPITYNLLYSTDNGITWSSFVNDTIFNFYDWAPIAFPNGDYILRIETMAAGDVVTGTDISVIVYNPGNGVSSTTGVTSSVETSTTSSQTTTTSDPTTTSSTTTTSSFIIDTNPIGGTATTDESKTAESTSESTVLPISFLTMLGAFIVISVIRLLKSNRWL